MLGVARNPALVFIWILFTVEEVRYVRLINVMCWTFVTKHTEHSLSVYHLTDHANRTERRYISRYPVNPGENPKARVAHQSTLDMDVHAKRPQLYSAACFYDHIPHQQALPSDA